MSLYKTEGVILRSKAFGEADRLLTIYTKGFGKVRGVAKGARRPRSRFVGTTQAFTYADFLIFRGRSLDDVSQVGVRESFARLRDDIELMAYASYMAELVDIFTEEREANEPLFALLLSCFSMLSEGRSPRLMSLTFQAQMISILGYRPMLERCVRCQGKPENSRLGFSPKAGGLVCERCYSQDEGDFRVSPQAASLLGEILAWDASQVDSLAFLPGPAGEVGHMLRSFISYRSEREPKSLKFLDSLGMDGKDAPGPLNTERR